MSNQFIIYIPSTRDFQYQFSLSYVDDNADGDPSIQLKFIPASYGTNVL